MVRTRASIDTGRKRRASTMADEDAPAEAVVTQHSQSTRPKRTRRSANDQLVDELTDAAATQSEAVEQNGTFEQQENKQQKKKARFSSPASSPPVRTHQFTGPSQQLAGASFYTPQPTKSTRLSHGRPSLPPRLDGPSVEINFPPLSDAIAPRTQRRLKRHRLSETQNELLESRNHEKREVANIQKELDSKNERLRELELELENRRQMGTADGMELDENHQAIESLKRVVAELEQKLAAAPNSPLPNTEMEDTEFYSDDDEMPFTDPADLNMLYEDTKLSAGFEYIQATPVAASNNLPPDQAKELAFEESRQKLEAIQVKCAKLQSQYDSISFEMTSLGFSGPDDPTLTIIATIRQEFDQARLEFQELVPNIDIEQYSNRDFLFITLEHLRGTQNQAQELHKEKTDIHFELENKIDRIEVLENRWRQNDRERDEMHKKNVGLQAELEDSQNTVTNQAADIAKLNANVNDFQKEVEVLREEIQNLKTQLDEEKISRRKSEVEGNEQIEALETQKKDLVDNLEAAGVALEEKETENEELATRLANEITELEEDMKELSQQRDAERRQREQIQEDFDNLDKELSQLRVEKNTALSDLFAAQQEGARLVNEATTREEAIAELDKLLALRAARVEELGVKIEEEKAAVKKLVDALNKKIANQDAELEDARKIYAQLTEETESEIKDLEQQIDDLNKKVAEQVAENEALIKDNQDKDGEIVDLKDDIGVARGQITELKEQVGQKDVQIEQRDVRISDLQTKLAVAQQKVRDYAKRDAQIARESAADCYFGLEEGVSDNDALFTVAGLETAQTSVAVTETTQTTTTAVVNKRLQRSKAQRDSGFGTMSDELEYEDVGEDEWIGIAS